MSGQVGTSPARKVIGEGQPQENGHQPEDRHDDHGPRLRGTAQGVHEEQDHQRGLDDGDRLTGDDPHHRRTGNEGQADRKDRQTHQDDQDGDICSR